MWSLNYFNRLPKVGRGILQGWELSGILTAQSGRPYSGLLYFDLNNDGVYATDRTPGLGRNTFYTPATLSLDPRLARNVSVGERARLQIIVEGFNILNHANIISVNDNQYAVSDCGASRCLVPQNRGVSAFGTPSISLGARVMQLAVKLTF